MLRHAAALKEWFRTINHLLSQRTWRQDFSEPLSHVASFSLPSFLSLSTVYFLTKKSCHLSNLKRNMPPRVGSTHGMIGNDLTGDKKMQSQHEHRVSTMCKIDKIHSLWTTWYIISSLLDYITVNTCCRDVFIITQPLPFTYTCTHTHTLPNYKVSRFRSLWFRL